MGCRVCCCFGAKAWSSGVLASPWRLHAGLTCGDTEIPQEIDGFGFNVLGFRVQGFYTDAKLCDISV